MRANPRFQMVMTPEAHAALMEIADRDNRVMADVIRIALERYIKEELKRDVNFKVQRGGDRRPGKDQP